MQAFAALTKNGQLRRLGRSARPTLAAFGIEEARLTPLRYEDNTGERYVLRIHRPSHKTAAEVGSEMT